MQHASAVVAASAAAAAVYKSLGNGGAWLADLGSMKVDELVIFLQENATAPPEALYRHASGRHYDRRPWGSDEALTAAVETFAAVLPQMLSRVERDSAPLPPAPTAGFGRRTFDRRRPGMGKKLKLATPAAAAEPEAAPAAGDEVPFAPPEDPAPPAEPAKPEPREARPQITLPRNGKRK